LKAFVLSGSQLYAFVHLLELLLELLSESSLHILLLPVLLASVLCLFFSLLDLGEVLLLCSFVLRLVLTVFGLCLLKLLPERGLEARIALKDVLITLIQSLYRFLKLRLEFLDLLLQVQVLLVDITILTLHRFYLCKYLSVIL
tara:strand:- start:454 stop:882 length:429 start_codon:yes stop_codon:yes gene_type:complete